MDDKQAAHLDRLREAVMEVEDKLGNFVNRGEVAAKAALATAKALPKGSDGQKAVLATAASYADLRSKAKDAIKAAAAAHKYGTGLRKDPKKLKAAQPAAVKKEFMKAMAALVPVEMAIARFDAVVAFKKEMAGGIGDNEADLKALVNSFTFYKAKAAIFKKEFATFG